MKRNIINIFNNIFCLLALILFMNILTGCGYSNNNTERNNTTKRNKYVYFDSTKYTKLYADEHEYIKFDIGSSTWGGHSGSCQNPIHKQIIHDTLYLEVNETHSKL